MLYGIDSLEALENKLGQFPAGTSFQLRIEGPNRDPVIERLRRFGKRKEIVFRFGGKKVRSRFPKDRPGTSDVVSPLRAPPAIYHRPVTIPAYAAVRAFRTAGGWFLMTSM